MAKLYFLDISLLVPFCNVNNHAKITPIDRQFAVACGLEPLPKSLICLRRVASWTPVRPHRMAAAYVSYIQLAVACRMQTLLER
jgi:hypothetical protein